ncbi:MAG TPA: diacylglycerol kinase family lipid kinase [Paludibacteraceae bacterium]|mgnify:CR=1 FL=1|nr:diacylglycerol kinase family lipid kinase [Paludibacteraceae bacterium]
MERKKIVFIVNPKSGTLGKSNWIALSTKMLAKEFDLAFQYTTHRGHACELAQKAVAQKVPIVVAVGGDGTVNEIASALIHTSTALAILPLGSGNGLARDLGISPLLPFSAVEVIKKGKIKEIDYGTANGVPFFCTCGVGFDAHISRIFATNKKRGFWNYLILAIREYFRYKPIECTLEYDGKTEHRRAFIVNCANIQQLGNNAYIAPKADYTDGLLNITILKPFGLLGAIRLGTFLFLKQIDKIRYTETFACKEIVLNIPPNTPFHYDGEPAKVPNRIEIKAVNLGLKVVIP